MHQVVSVAGSRLTRGAVRLALLALGAAAAILPGQSQANDFCPNIYRAGVLPLNFNPTFTSIGKFNAANGNSYDGLVVSSFFNAIKDPQGLGSVGFFQRDLVARITGIGYRSPSWWNATRDTEVLTDLDVLPSIVEPLDLANALPTNSGPGQQVWPNESRRVPDGILSFEAIVSPQGFHPTPQPGRLSLINLDDANRTEYIIDQSVQDLGGPCRFEDADDFTPLSRPYFYHKVKWADMDGDGLKDAVTVRAGFKVSGAFCIPPPGQVVWFKNPGAAIDPNIEWAEFVVAGVSFGPNPPGEDSRYSADIELDVADLEGDGVPEIIGGNFFTSGSFFTPTDKAIELYGAPLGAANWAGVNPTTNPARIAVLSTNSTNGPTFGVRFVDLNRDGKLDVLATNHQTDNCFPRTQTPVPGRVYALEQPASGDIFNDPWIQHILKDGIRPNPTYPAPNNDPSGPGRLAPGLAQEFWPSPLDEHSFRPWILVGGDEASKVWLLKPNDRNPGSTDWTYSSAVIFDINDYYGPNTSQSFTAPPPATGVSISTIGAPSWRYDRDWAWGSWAEIYIPVFEGRDIHRITFRPRAPSQKIVCPADGQLACPVF